MEKTLKPWKVERFCLGKPSAQYVAKMEDVIGVYARPFDRAQPVVCVDEARKELRTTPRGSSPLEAGQVKREDYEYAREGAVNRFLAVESLTAHECARGKRHVEVTERRTAKDFARFLKGVSDSLYPEAERIVLVVDNSFTPL